MNPTRQRSPRRTASQWHQIVEAQQASGLSAPKFCKEKQISYPSFMNWRKKLTDSTCKNDKKLPTFIELTPQPETESPAIGDSQEGQPLRIELDLGAGIHLRIYRAG